MEERRRQGVAKDSTSVSLKTAVILVLAQESLVFVSFLFRSYAFEAALSNLLAAVQRFPNVWILGCFLERRVAFCILSCSVGFRTSH